MIKIIPLQMQCICVVVNLIVTKLGDSRNEQANTCGDSNKVEDSSSKHQLAPD